jgi:hypothetical protein
MKVRSHERIERQFGRRGGEHYFVRRFSSFAHWSYGQCNMKVKIVEGSEIVA